jgi:hypothetical protein
MGQVLKTKPLAPQFFMTIADFKAISDSSLLDLLKTRGVISCFEDITRPIQRASMHDGCLVSSPRSRTHNRQPDAEGSPIPSPSSSCSATAPIAPANPQYKVSLLGPLVTTYNIIHARFLCSCLHQITETRSSDSRCQVSPRHIP